MVNKRGDVEFGVGVSIFVFIMALLIIIYLLLIPPEERNRILDDGDLVGIDCSKNCREDVDQCVDRCRSNSNCRRECDLDFKDCMDDCSDRGRDGFIEGRGSLLLSESPGLVKPLQNSKLSINLNPVSLYSEISKINIPLSNSLQVSSWLLSGDVRSINFDLGNIKTLGKVSLVFLPSKRDGVLRIELNGNIVYEGGAEVSALPIELPINLLKEGRNKLSFGSKATGLGKSLFVLTDVSLSVNRFEDNLRSNRNFILVKDEIDGMKRAFLSYFLSCDNINVNQGELRIDINGKNLYDDTIFCETARPSIDISRNSLREGENRLDFVLKPVSGNNYRITDLKLGADMSSFDFPKFRFDLGRRQFEDVASGRADVVMNLLFPDARFRKEANVNINGAELYFNTNGGFIKIDLSDFIVAGTNFVKIVPKEIFEIDRLDILIE